MAAIPGKTARSAISILDRQKSGGMAAKNLKIVEFKWEFGGSNYVIYGREEKKSRPSVLFHLVIFPP